jgi:O-antigen/teichoic acid export membrane protein
VKPGGTIGSASRSLRADLLVNLAGTGWSALVQFACIPIYFAVLGAERYALIAFSASLQLALKALDLGVSHTANRELAARTASGRTEGVRELLRTLEAAYCLVGMLLGAMLAAAAPLIATRWFGESSLGPVPVTVAVRLIGLFIAVQWPLSLYQSALLGLGRATLMNWLAIASSTLAGGGSVMLLLAWRQSLVAVLAWQAGVALCHTLAVALATHGALAREARPARITPSTLVELRAMLTGVGAITLSLLLLLQADKLLASRWLPLAEYGYYMLGATVSNGLGVLSAPVFNTLLPRLSALSTGDDTARLASEFRRGTRLLTLFVFPAMIAAGVLSADLLRLWTRDADTARLAAAPATLLLVGMGSASLLQLSMALQMAMGRTRAGTRINLLLLIAFVPLGLMASRSGAAGVAGAWAGLLGLGALFGGAAIHRRLLGSGSGQRLIGDIARPLAAMLGVTLVAWPLLSVPAPPALAALRLVVLGAVLTAVSAAVNGIRPSLLRGLFDPSARAS